LNFISEIDILPANFSADPLISNLIEIHLVAAEMKLSNGQTDRHNLPNRHSCIDLYVNILFYI